MADWRAQLSYNYNPPYHAYAYGLMYQAGPEQNHGNLGGWVEAGVNELGSYNSGMTPAFYAGASGRTQEESPPQSPDQRAVSGHGHYQGSGVVYLGNTQAGHLFLSAPHRSAYDTRENEPGRAGSDSTSDSEAHTSPDSWSSASSREGSLPQADPTTWAKRDLDDETDRGSPDVSEDVSSSMGEEPHCFAISGNQSTDAPTPLPVPLCTPKKSSTTAVTNAKGKARTAFTESQMNTLVQRFSVQRYLTPAEMKKLAGLTGLTYKQVKTWFQNRRMKLRRHQKDTSWVSERYNLNKDSPNTATTFTNMPPNIQAYQGEAQAHIQEQYNQQMRDAAAFKTRAPQNLAYYLAAVGAAGSAGYPSWSSTPSQTAAATRPQATSWHVTPPVGHYEYNPNTFSTASITTAANTSVHNTSCDSKDGEPAHASSPLQMAMVHNPSQ